MTSRPYAVFKIESRVNGSRLVVHAQSMMPYPANSCGTKVLIELERQAQNYDTKYHIDYSNCGVRCKTRRILLRSVIMVTTALRDLLRPHFIIKQMKIMYDLVL